MDARLGGEREQHESQHESTPQTAPETAPLDAGVQQVEALLARGDRTPSTYAELLRAHPGSRARILALLHGSLGNAIVQQIVDGAHAQPSELPLGPVQVHGAAHGLRVRSTPDQTHDNILGMLADHETTTATAKAGEWLAIDHPKGPAFIHGHFVQPVTAGTGAPAGAHVAAPSHVADETKPAPVLPPAAVVSATPAPTPTVPAIVAPAPQQPAGHAGGGASHVEPPAPVVAPENKVDTAAPTTAPGNFRTQVGNEIAATTHEEAVVLNEIRKDPNRLDPDWLRTTQGLLGVKDATGAMNTETLRALRAKLGAAPFTAASVMDQAFLSSLNAAGSPFFGTAELGYRAKDQQRAPGRGATTPKDRTAQDLHYASYADYQGDWTSVKLLGKNLGQGHKYLAHRVAAADAYLRGRFPGVTKKEDLWAKAGWNGEGNASYADAVTDNATHQHAMGLAIDIDPGQNAYLFDHHVEGKTRADSDWFVKIFTDTFEIASKLYGSPMIDQTTLFNMSAESSTEELVPKVEAASEGFKNVLAMSKRGVQKEIHDALEPHYKGAELKDRIKTVTNINSWFHMQEGRREAKGPTNLKQELVIALRDVAGLAWGGTEMDPNENADFMHFDCRQTDFGKDVYRAGLAHHVG